MNAGRELDALVAEKVMGWVRHPDKHDMIVMSPPDLRGYGAQFGQHPHYSTDIAAAWEVVEKVIAEFPAPEYQFGVTWVSAKDGWGAGMGHFQDGESYSDEWYSVFGETAPHAICLAALKAKGIDVAT